MTLGPHRRPAPLRSATASSPKVRERTLPLGDKPPRRELWEVLLICRGYLCYSGFVCLAAPAALAASPRQRT